MDKRDAALTTEQLLHTAREIIITARAIAAESDMLIRNAHDAIRRAEARIESLHRLDTARHPVHD